MKFRYLLNFSVTAILFIISSSITRADTSELVFTNIAAQNGVDLPNLLTESLAWGDYDNDGDEDLFISIDGQNRLFKNQNGSFFDVSTGAGILNTDRFSVGAAFGDLDNDGDKDLIVINFDDDQLDELYRNDGPIGPNGAYVFTEIASIAGITDDSISNSSRGVTLIDYDNDSLLDIYVIAISGHDIFYRNLGNLQFESIALNIGLDASGGESVGVVTTDMNNDNLPDIFAANRSSDPSALYLNNGDGTFTDVALSAGIDKVGLGMGVLQFDYDNDGDFDLYWTTFPGTETELVSNALYENLYNDTGAIGYVDMAVQSGTLDTNGWGISCNASDIDNDGWEDFFVTNGASSDSSANVLFRNNGDKTFANVTDVIGGADFDGRGIAFADWDNDGDSDFVLTSGPGDDTQMWRNDSPNNNHWITFKLEGSQSNRSAIGTRITVSTDLGTYTKMVGGGAGRGSFNSIPLEFGLGQAEQITNVEIVWPSGLVKTLNDVSLDQIVMVKELTVEFDNICPGTKTFNIVGATPNNSVSVYSGFLGVNQPGEIASGNCAGEKLDMTRPVLLGQTDTNNEGEAVLRTRKGARFCASTSQGFQVVNNATCSISDVIPQNP